MTDETHYEVVGVAPGAAKDEIREAYRARVDELAQGKQSDESRQETARLNAAWQVLSDPYQRGRYDQAIGIDLDADGDADEPDADEPDADEEAADDEDAEPGGSEETPRQRRARERTATRERPGPGSRVSMFSAEHEEPPPTWPSGLRPPPPRARVIAMGIDVLVLIAISVAVLFGGGRIVESTHREEFDRVDVLNDRIDRLERRQDRAEERADNAADDAQEEIDDIEGDLAPAQLALQAALLVLALVYLVPSSVISGRTLGKQLMRIRVVDADGSKLGPRSAFFHYGTPVLAALALQSFLGQLAPLVVLLGVLTWPRNANRQGLHDRLAGTLVVDG